MRKLAFLVAAIFAFAGSTLAQINQVPAEKMLPAEKGCATTITPEQQALQDQMLQEYKRIEREFLEKYHSRALEVEYWIPMKLHIVRTSAGTGGIDVNDLNDAIDNMNNFYNNAGMQFYQCGSINYIDSDTYYNFDSADEAALTSAHNVANLINIYFCNSVTSGGSGACGYAYYPGGPDVIMMDNSCTLNGSTFPHEMGHFFSLRHTHGGTANELVDGSNCETEGDYICDTPADPNVSGNVNGSCIYTGGATDANGDPYAPNTRNIMSYSLKACRTEFSAGQYARAYAAYVSSRNYFTCPSFEADFTASATETCGSSLTVNFTDGSAGATSWAWDVDGDGVTDYTTQNPSHTYNTAGSYDVRLEISDGSRTIAKTEIGLIKVGAQGSIDYSEDFESFTESTSATGYGNGWSTSPAGTTTAFRWNVHSGTTPSGGSGTGPAVDGTTGTASGLYIHTEASGYSTGDLAYLYSPCIELNASQPQLSFKYHMFGSNMGTLHLDIDAGSGWVNDIATLTGQQQGTQGAAWLTQNVNLTAYAGQTVQFRFRGERGNGFRSDMAIDDIAITNVSTTPEISFVSATATQAESSASGTSGCRGYVDVNVALQIQAAPTGAATVTFAKAGTATDGVDYELVSPTVVFPNGGTANQNVVVRVYDETALETDETIVLTYAISGSTNAVAGVGNQSCTITITDNDLAPANNPGEASNILTADFESGLPAGWSRSQAGGSSGWVFGLEGALGSTYFNIPASNTTQIAASNDDACNCDASVDYLVTPALDLRNYQTTTLTFDGYSPNAYGSTAHIVVSTGSATGPWTNVATMATNTAWESETVDLSAYAGLSNVYVGFHHDDNGSWASGFAIDNVVISGNDGYADVSTTLNNTATQYLGPNSTVYWYDSGNDLLAKIENTTTWDYGCTQVQIDRAGSGTSPYTTSNSSYHLMDKTILVTPANNNPSGTYTITMYFTETEVATWETNTGNARTVLNLMKTGGSVDNISPASPAANGATNFNGTATTREAYAANEYKVSATFNNGFSGFGGGLDDPVTVPVEWISFEGRKLPTNENLLEWMTGSETNNDYFVVERSADGEVFRSIGEVTGAGTTSMPQQYEHLDRSNEAANDAYYRLQQVDFDGTARPSHVIRIAGQTKNFGMHVFSTETAGQYRLQLDTETPQTVRLMVLNPLGQVVREQQVALREGIQSMRVDLSDQAAGMYILRMTADDHMESTKLMR